MASSQRSHFIDRLHPLHITTYSHDGPHHCNICLFRLAGFVSHHCSHCHLHIHDACANYFQETVAFFAHPWHDLTLRRIDHPATTIQLFCDLCLGHCPPGTFVYSCVKCSFNVHPLCSKLQQKIRSPLHPGHHLRLLPSSGDFCAACHQRLPVWHYRCSCSFRLHIACAANSEPAAGSHGNYYHSHGNHGSYSHGSYGDHGVYNYNHGSYGGGGQTDIAATPSRMNAIAKFLLKTSFHIAMNAATGGLASPLVEILLSACLW